MSEYIRIYGTEYSGNDQEYTSEYNGFRIQQNTVHNTSEIHVQHVVRNALRFAEFSDLDYCLGGCPPPPLPPDRRSTGPPVRHAAELLCGDLDKRNHQSWALRSV